MRLQNRLWMAPCVLCLAAAVAHADVQSEMQKEAEALQPALQAAGPMLAEGRVDEADKRILSTFPEKSRSAVESLLLGNVLFKQDPATSYALHKRAAADLPDEPIAQLEWAMEQHRAGEYAGASASYQKFIKAQPTFGPALGMWAECLIRTGQTRAAADAWARSEQGGGSLEQFESWVCDVHTHDRPDHDREGFYQKVKAGDSAAAANLVGLDCNFPEDWWNAGPKANYLEKDLDMLSAAPLKDKGLLNETECAAKCALVRAKGEGDVAGLLRAGGFLLDAHATLPQNGKLLAAMVSAALEQNVVSSDDARRNWGEKILNQARTTHDAAWFNVAAHLYLGTDRLPEIDQLGWDATGDQRFAASLLVGLAGKGSLKLEDPRLVRASKQFPDNSEIAKIVLELTKKSGKPMEPALIGAIEAEYCHFSFDSPLSPRPNAAALRVYFAELSKIEKPK